MQAYRVLPGDGIDGLHLTETPGCKPNAHEVRIRVHAVSLNYRDLMVAGGTYLVTAAHPIVPCSDGAGEVVSVGPAVTRVKPGDRVVASFFPHWLGWQPLTCQDRQLAGWRH